MNKLNKITCRSFTESIKTANRIYGVSEMIRSNIIHNLVSNYKYIEHLSTEELKVYGDISETYFFVTYVETGNIFYTLVEESMPKSTREALHNIEINKAYYRGRGRDD